MTPSAAGAPVERVLATARDLGVDEVHLQFTDVSGTLKSLTVPGRRLERVLTEGAWFDGSSVEGVTRTAEEDLFLRPDPATFAPLPWGRAATARLVCDVTLADGAPFAADPRRALRAALDAAADLGFAYRVSAEVEFFTFEGGPDGGVGRPVPVDRSGYFEASERRATALCAAAVEALTGFGVPVDATHHEVGPGQHEIDLGEQDALRLADALVALKWALRVLGSQQNLRVSFMPRPLADAPGSGLHLAQVLASAADGGNAFADPDGPYGLSPLAGSFLAGQLAHARALCAVVAPLVNSYKRLDGAAEAPSRVAWARVHRGALLRVPEPGAGGAARLEFRAPDPSCNPYLALAAMLAAGLDGVRRRLEPPRPVEESDHPGEADEAAGEAASPLPATLGEALDELAWSPVVREALGQPTYERFAAAKEAEWLAYVRHVSQWEIDRYLDRA